MKDDSENILVITGPTATGKSEIAARLAASLDGEVLSADSMQVYEGMDIGTAKPTKELLKLAPHHLIGFVKPSDDFSVAKYQKKARALVADILRRRRLPIVAGGSGLYVRAIIDPVDFPTRDPESDQRLKLEKLAEISPESLFEMLKEVDPQGAVDIDKNNTRRIVRAIEAVLVSGEDFRTRSERWKKREAIFNVLIVGLRMDRERLVRQINERVDDMVKAGLEGEVRALYDRSLGISRTARQALGYKEFIDYFEGRVSYKEAIELIKIRTRQFAKRQMTWFKADPRVIWFEVDGQKPSRIIEGIVERIHAKGFIVS